MRKEESREKPRHDVFEKLAASETAVTAAVSELESVQENIDIALTTLQEKTAQSIESWQGDRNQLVKRIDALSKWPPSVALDARLMRQSLQSFLRRALLRKIAKHAPIVLLLVGLSLIVLLLIL